MSGERRRQWRALFGIELRRALWTHRAVPVYLLAAFPVALAVLLAVVVAITGADGSEIQAEGTFAGIFHTLHLRFVVYLACVFVFTNLFRGDILDRSLHFYFMAPISRSRLLAGKYAAGLAGATIILVGSLALTYGIIAAAGGGGGPGLAGSGGSVFLGHLAAYAFATFMAVMGYGAVFTVLGLYLRNPLLPAIVILGWESANVFLPPLLKRISVVHYVEALAPVAAPSSPFAVLAEAVPAWRAVVSLVALAGVALWVGRWRVRRVEVVYGGD